jgi:hypothetical protein
MCWSENTVKNYPIFNKLGVPNRFEVVKYAASQRQNLTPRRSMSVAQLPFSVVAAAGNY